MGTTFSHFKVKNFPKLKRKAIAGSVIVTLGDSQLQGKTEQTRMTFKVDSVYGDYERYEVYHEYLKKAEGRTYDGREFDHFFQKNSFDVFLDRKNGLLICNAPRRVAKSLIDTLNDRKPGQFNFDYMQVDFSAVQGRTSDVRGVWVSNMAEPFLDTAAFFGHDVEQSDSCKNAQASGKASSKLIFYGYGDQAFPIILSSHCSVSFLRDDPEELNVDILRHIHGNLLKFAMLPEDSHFNGKAKRKAAAEAAKAAKAAKALAAKSNPPEAQPSPLFTGTDGGTSK